MIIVWWWMFSKCSNMHRFTVWELLSVEAEITLGVLPLNLIAILKIVFESYFLLPGLEPNWRRGENWRRSVYYSIVGNVSLHTVASQESFVIKCQLMSSNNNKITVLYYNNLLELLEKYKTQLELSDLFPQSLKYSFKIVYLIYSVHPSRNRPLFK